MRSILKWGAAILGLALLVGGVHYGLRRGLLRLFPGYYDPPAVLYEVRALDRSGSAVTVWPGVTLAPQQYLRQIAPALAFTNADGRMVVLYPPYDYREAQPPQFEPLVR